MSKKRHVRDAQVVERVRRELIKRKGGWKELPSKADNVFTYRWVAAFAAGDIKEPSYTRITALARLMGIEIDVIGGDGKH